MNGRNTFGIKAAEILGGYCCTLLLLILENSGSGFTTIHLHYLVLPTQPLYTSALMKDTKGCWVTVDLIDRKFERGEAGVCYILNKDRLSVGDKLYFDLVLPLALLHPMVMMPLVSVHQVWADFDQAHKM